MPWFVRVRATKGSLPTLQELRDELDQQALALAYEHAGTKDGAAELLGVNRRTIYNIEERLEFDVRDPIEDREFE